MTELCVNTEKFISRYSCNIDSSSYWYAVTCYIDGWRCTQLTVLNLPLHVIKLM